MFLHQGAILRVFLNKGTQVQYVNVGICFLLALQPPLGVVFYSPLAGFCLLAYEVS